MTAPADKPRLRGVLHEAAFYATLVAGAWLVGAAAPRYRVAVAVYVATLAAQLGASALYHRPTWPPAHRQWLRRCDHATIFLLIAGTGTPVARAIGPASGARLLAVLWIGGGIGVLRALFWIGAPKWLVAAIAVALGCLCFTFLPAFDRALDATTVHLLVGGGLLYTCGATAYAVKRPALWPRTFGYHELFHAFTIVAAALHFVAIHRLTRAF